MSIRKSSPQAGPDRPAGSARVPATRLRCLASSHPYPFPFGNPPSLQLLPVLKRELDALQAEDNKAAASLGACSSGNSRRPRRDGTGGKDAALEYHPSEHDRSGGAPGRNRTRIWWGLPTTCCVSVGPSLDGRAVTARGVGRPASGFQSGMEIPSRAARTDGNPHGCRAFVGSSPYKRKCFNSLLRLQT